MTAPPLSNYLTVLADQVRGEVAAFKRSSTAAHEAYIAAGSKLVDAREAARRGQRGSFLEACGISERVARNMMALARSGLTAEEITERSGVQASIEALRSKAPGEEKPESDSGDEATARRLSGTGEPAGAGRSCETPGCASTARRLRRTTCIAIHVANGFR